MTRSSIRYEVAAVGVFLVFLAVSVLAGVGMPPAHRASLEEPRPAGLRARNIEMLSSAREGIYRTDRAILRTRMMEMCLTLLQEPEYQCSFKAKRFVDVAMPIDGREQGNAE